MKQFLSKYLFLVVWVVVIAVIGAIFVWIVQPSLHFGTPLDTTPPPPSSGSAGTPTAPATPTTTISLIIQKLKTGNSLIVQWQNLPAGTTQLNIFEGSKNATSGWSLWKSVLVTPDQLQSGNTTLDLGKGSVDGKSFYIQAVNGSSTDAGGAPEWVSPVIQPVVTTSTNPLGNPTNGGGGNNNSTSTGNGSSTVFNPSPAPAPSPSSTSTTTIPTNPSSPTPSGTAFYNPQVQIEGYQSAQAGNFWVQHIDQKIQIGWQDLPPNTDNVIILRAANQDGPWSVVLTQKNPGVNGTYSIQVVDNTLGDPYYYEMNAAAGSTTVATYGPVYLPASTQ